MNKKRTLIFFCLAVGLLLGIYLNWSMISRDMNRLEPWKIPLLWTGDLFALLFAFRWMLKQDDNGELEHLPKHFRLNNHGKMIVLLIAGSLLCDVAVTGYSLWDSKQSMKRAVAAKATIRSTKEVHWDDRATHYTVVADFDDKQQRSHRVSVKFTNKLQEQPGQWLIDAIGSTKKGQGSPVKIVYDPTWPQRAWVAGQPWDDTSSISAIFAVIHILQVIVVASGIDSILTSKGSQIGQIADRVSLYPLVCEVCLLILFGLMLSN